MSTKVCCVSDLHGFLPVIQPCDLLLIAGDVCPVQDHSLPFQARWLAGEFTDWLAKVPAKAKFWTAGNHDFYLQHPDPGFQPPPGYVQDAAVDKFGLKLWFSPWSSQFGQWAFMDDEAGLARRYAPIPAGLDFLISHGPPLNAGDRMVSGQCVGSNSLRTKIVDVHPRFVVCGHIHEARGQYIIGQTRVLNVSYLNEHYRPVFEPVYLDVPNPI